MKMPFGKYCGRPLERIPESYLLWVLDHCENIRPTLRNAIRNRLAANQRMEPLAPVPPWEDVLRTWYRSLAMDFHPDRNGSTAAMQAINEAYDRLRRLLGLPAK